MIRYLLWVNLEEGWIAFEYKLDDIHHHYEYLEIGKKQTRIWPKLRPPPQDKT